MRSSSCLTSAWKPRVSFATAAGMRLSTRTFSGNGGPGARAKDEAGPCGFQVRPVRPALPLPQARMDLAGTLPVKNAGPMNFRRFRFLAALPLFVPALVPAQPAGAGLPAGIARITSVEGVAEYRLANGLKILLIPDRSIDTVTVNVDRKSVV